MTEIRRGIPINGTDEKTREELQWQQMIRKMLKGDKKVDVKKIDEYLNSLLDIMKIDSNMFLFKVYAKYDEKTNTIILKGLTEHKFHKNIPERIFQKLGFNVKNEIEILPSENMKNKLFGIINVPSVYVYESPNENSEKMTQSLYGDYCFLLKELDDFYLIHTDEGYLGYIKKKFVKIVSEDFFAKYINSQKVFLKETVKVNNMKLSSGTVLRFVNVNGNMCRVKLINDEEIEIDIEKVHIFNSTYEIRKNMLEFARKYLNVPYVWGGKSGEGIDCSGFIQTIYRFGGINLPRDAYQQFYAGKLVATPWFTKALEIGDILYFIEPIIGKIGHIAFSEGKTSFIHADEPFVNQKSIDKEDKNYVVKRKDSFIFAKRIFVQ